MRIDDSFLHEVEPPFSYHPQGIGCMYNRRHSELYYSYHADNRECRLNMLAEKEPELAVAIECVKAMGLFDDCIELSLLSAFRDRCPDEEIRYYRENAPKIAQALSAQKEYLHELYFSLILPIAAAIDADEARIAHRICRAGMVRLANEMNSQS